jgi:alkaline phosphatase D
MFKPSSPSVVRALALAASLLAACSAQAADVVSRFDSSTEGWLVGDISSLPGAGVAATWDSAAQRITTSDIATWTTYSAPATFLGNKLAFYGGSFSFDLTDNLKDDNADSIATFGIASGTTALYWFGGAPSTTAMSSFNAGLSAADSRWRIGGLPTDFASGTAPSAAQFQAVLGALTAIRINADWKTAGNDITALDNVVLAAAPVPEPAAGWLMAAGLAVFALRQWPRPARS